MRSSMRPPHRRSIVTLEETPHAIAIASPTAVLRLSRERAHKGTAASRAPAQAAISRCERARRGQRCDLAADLRLHAAGRNTRAAQRRCDVRVEERAAADDVVRPYGRATIQGRAVRGRSQQRSSCAAGSERFFALFFALKWSHSKGHGLTQRLSVDSLCRRKEHPNRQATATNTLPSPPPATLWQADLRR